VLGHYAEMLRPNSVNREDSVTIFVLIDALGWYYVERSKFLIDLLAFRRKLQTILGYSSAAIPCIVTGKMPNENGHFNFWYYSPETSPFRWARNYLWIPRIFRALIGMKRSDIERKSKVRNHLSGYFALYNIPIKYLHLYDTCEKKNVLLPRGIDNGVDSIFDLLEQKGVDYGSYTYPLKDEDIVSKTVESLTQKPHSFYFLYMTEMDGHLHKHCSNWEKVEEKIHYYDTSVRRILAAAQATGRSVNVYVMSDHGMTPTTNEFDLIKLVDKLGLSIPGDYVPMYDSTMARFWFFNEDARIRITELLSTLQCGSILERAEMSRLGVHFEDGQFGDLLFLMKPGHVINPSYMGQAAPIGMHGFHPDKDSYAPAMIIGNRSIPDNVVHIKDLFHFMLRFALQNK